MKISDVIATISLFVFSNLTFAGDALPNGVIKKGSWTNQKLAKDTMIGVAGKVAILGCSKPEFFTPYIIQDPKGKAGERIWWELWIVTGCNNKYPIKISFNEAGTSAANWTIE